MYKNRMITNFVNVTKCNLTEENREGKEIEKSQNWVERNLHFNHIIAISVVKYAINDSNAEHRILKYREG